MELQVVEPHKRADLWTTLNRIQRTLGVEDKTFADMLGLSPVHLVRLRNWRLEPPASHVFGLADQLRVSIENLSQGKIDYRALTEAYGKNTTYIPERYAEVAFSRRRAALPILAYLEARGGEFLVDRELRHFQMHPAAFIDPDASISIRFLTDLCDRLSRQGFTRADFVEMGTFSVQANRGGPVEKAMREQPSPGAIYELFVGELAPRYDDNWRYGLTRLTKDVAEIQVTPRAEVAEAMKTKQMGSSLLCWMKGGVGASFLGYRGWEHAGMKHVKCVHRGDSECLYEFAFPDAAKLAPAGPTLRSTKGDASVI